MERRVFLLSTATASASALAGCLGPVEGGSEGDREAATPTDAVEGYFRAIADGDRAAANEFAHPDGDYYIDAEGDHHVFRDPENVTISETETVTVEEGVRNMIRNPEEFQVDEWIEDEKTALEELQEEYGFDDYAYVRHDAGVDGHTFNTIYVLVEDDGWVIWSLPTVIDFVRRSARERNEEGT